MRAGCVAALSALVALTATVDVAQPQAPQPSLEQVLQRMGAYVTAYGERAALIVATEKYIQRVSSEDGTNFPPRQLLAEFAIVKVPGPVGWVGFRDVVQVNGESLTDRRDRLAKLLSDSAGDVGEARRISNESARFNIGPISRNFNVPTTTLFFFHPANLPRFTFKMKGMKKIDGIDTCVLDFKETRHPSLVMKKDGTDAPCEGTVWVSPADGTIVRTLVTFRGFADEKVGQEATGRPTSPSSTATQSTAGAPAASPAPPSVQPPAQPQPQPPAQPAPPAAGGTPSGQTRGAGASSGQMVYEPAPAISRGLSAREVLAGTADTRRLESLARIDVTYSRHDRFGMWLPSKMSELYEGSIPRGPRPPLMGRVTATADYSEFKQFETSAKVTFPK